MANPIQTSPSFLGRGLAYPIQIATKGGLALTEGETLVTQSISEILLTDINERPFTVKEGVPFGSRLPSYLFRSAEEVRDLATFEVKRALDLWEPRIVVNYVEVTDHRADGAEDPRYVRIVVNYRYRSSNMNTNWSKDFPSNARR